MYKEYGTAYICCTTNTKATIKLLDLSFGCVVSRLVEKTMKEQEKLAVNCTCFIVCIGCC